MCFLARFVLCNIYFVYWQLLFIVEKSWFLKITRPIGFLNNRDFRGFFSIDIFYVSQAFFGFKTPKIQLGFWVLVFIPTLFLVDFIFSVSINWLSLIYHKKYIFKNCIEHIISHRYGSEYVGAIVCKLDYHKMVSITFCRGAYSAQD